MDNRILTVSLFALYCVAFGALRYLLVGDAWGFLQHNLWLGSIPLVVAAVVKWRHWTGWRLALSWCGWLLFLPNSSYIVTDLIHIRGMSTIPWFDLILVFQFALAGLLIGALSIEWMHEAVSRSLGVTVSRAINSIVFFLCGIGMVMGRDLRMKSEEAFVEPLALFFRTIDAFDEASFIKSLVYASTFAAFYILFAALTRKSVECPAIRPN